MMERGALGELIPEHGESGKFMWMTHPGNDPDDPDGATSVYDDTDNAPIATFFGPKAIRLERVALFLTTEQS